MKDIKNVTRSISLKLFLIFLGVLFGLAVGVLDFFVSTLFFELIPNREESINKMLPAAIVGFIIFIAIVLVVSFFLRKRSKSFAIAFLITGIIICVIILVYLGSTKFYYALTF